MDELMETLRGWGAEPDEAVRRVMDDKQFYLRLLIKFNESDESLQLISAVAEKNYKEAFRAAHSIKGAAATLGLNPLLDAISRVVEDVREKPSCSLDEDLENFLATCSEFKQIMEAAPVQELT